jgi:thymidylate synthase ThyX
MKRPRRIYLLSPRNISPETIAVTFAKTSRSPKPFDEIADELTDERSARFHEKWVVGYGHSSVAEHAVLHLAMENVSRLAIETIEGNRLASYTEKSTRYQRWGEDAFYIPDELEGNALAEEFEITCSWLFTRYLKCMPKVETWLRTTIPQEKDETETGYTRRVRSSAADICRFLLPAASLANVGVTMNARTLEYAICKMLSSPLSEVQAIGEKLREVCRAETPTLVKYASCNDYLISVREKMRRYTDPLPKGDDEDFRLISWDEDGEDVILAALLFRFSKSRSYQACFDSVQSLSKTERENLILKLMEERSQFDQPLREFEYAKMTFEVVMDQGAYFEFKRHRMMTQSVQPLTSTLGFAIPKGIVESGCVEMYSSAMRNAASLYDRLSAWNQDVASYIVPNGFNRRVLFTMNLREAFHFCRLRAAENAHFSIQRVAFRIAKSILQIYPHLGRYLDIPEGITWRSVEDEYFAATDTR